HAAAVIEADHQIHAHPNAAAVAAHHPYDLGITLPQGHEIDQRCRSRVGFELGFENQSSRAIAAAHLRFGHGRQLPAAIFRISQQCGEAGVRIEPWQAQPIERSVAPDERGGLAISDERVIFNRTRHGRHSLRKSLIDDLSRVNKLIQLLWMLSVATLAISAFLCRAPKGYRKELRRRRIEHDLGRENRYRGSYFTNASKKAVSIRPERLTWTNTR